MASNRQVLKLNDASWLQMESAHTPMHVGMLLRFRTPEDAAPSYLKDLVEQWRSVRTFEAPFNFRLRGATLPRWETLADDQVDLDYHLRHSALPAPGGERELGVLVSRLHSTRLDRSYPLWELHVIEGLADDRWAMYFKVHHSQIDGVGGLRLLRRIFTSDADARNLLPPWAVGLHGPDQSGIEKPARPPREKPPRAGSPVRTARSIMGSLGRTYYESFTGPKDPLRAAPYRAPKTTFNTPISAPRRFATQLYGMERLRAVASAIDGSLNDVFLAICSGAIRRYLLELEDLPGESITANVPVSVRAEDGPGMGNAITFLLTQLRTDVEDPLERVRLIQQSIKQGKERLPKVGSAAMDAYTAGLMAPVMLQAVLGIGGHGRPSSNLVLSNVPGPTGACYVEGSRLEAIFPLSLLFNGQALNITGVSFDGQFSIGYTGCRDNVPHLQRIAVYSGEALEELEAALGIAAKRPRKRRTSPVASS
jgi:diacylglycerol O-acyltransferase / wax synthase